MGRQVLLSGAVVFFLGLCSVLNPYEKINELENDMKKQNMEMEIMREQLRSLTGGTVQNAVPARAMEVAKPTPPKTRQVTTTPKSSSQTDKSKMSLEELELAFQTERYNQLIEAPESDMLVWNASNRWKGDGIHKGGHRIYDRLLNNFDYCEVFGSGDTLPLDKPCRFILARGDKVRMGGLCHAAAVVTRHRKTYNVSHPHVLLFSFHEDYGGMRKPIEQKYKCGVAKEYLNHPDTIAAFTVQTHYTDIPKVHSIALGYRFLKHGTAIHQSLHEHKPTDGVNKKKKVMFNNNISHQKAQRLATLRTLQAAFNNSNSPVRNTFSKQNTLANYYHEMTESMFIASPIGLGGDCYRNYEAIFNGCIPLIEVEREKDGWRRTFDNMPVAWVKPGFHEVTPDWVEKEYRRILEGGPYNWKKTLRSWWINHIHALVDNHIASS